MWCLVKVCPISGVYWQHPRLVEKAEGQKGLEHTPFYLFYKSTNPIHKDSELMT
jgi:hypothetical protein